MLQYAKNTTVIILAISLIMLVGGIIGSVYCSLRINERLNWAESTGDPNASKIYKYRVVEDEIISLGTYLGVFADIAVIGGFTSLAVAFKKRFSWGGIKDLVGSLIVASVMLLVLVSIFLRSYSWEITIITIVLFILAIFLFMPRYINIRLRESLYILGMFLVILGTFGTVNLGVGSIFEGDGEFKLMYTFFILICIGVTIVGTLIILGAIFWPRRQADKLL